MFLIKSLSCRRSLGCRSPCNLRRYMHPAATIISITLLLIGPFFNNEGTTADVTGSNSSGINIYKGGLSIPHHRSYNITSGRNFLEVPSISISKSLFQH